MSGQDTTPKVKVRYVKDKSKSSTVEKFPGTESQKSGSETNLNYICLKIDHTLNTRQS